MHDKGSRVFRARLGIGERKIEDTDRFRIHRARHVEPRKIDAGRRALVRRGSRRSPRGLDQRVLPRDEASLLIPAPLAEVENRPYRRRRTLGTGIGGRQRQAAGLAEDDLVGSNFGRDIVGVRTNRHAVNQLQQRHLDEILPSDEAASRRHRRDNEESVARIRIDEAMKKAGLGQRHGHIGKRGFGDISYRGQRLGRGLHGIAERDRPARAAGQILARERGQLRAVETDADRLPLFQWHDADVGNGGASLAADRLDIDRLFGIEHQPQRIGATEQRRWRSRGE